MMKVKYNRYGVNINSLGMLFEKKEVSKLDTKMKAIRAFTPTNYFYQFFYNLKGYSVHTIDTNKMKLCYKNENIEFSKLSDLLVGSVEEVRPIKTELLKYKVRKGKCHYRAIEFFPSIGKNLVTGYVDDASGKVRTVHSWLETEKNVIDYTSNLVISKEDYYQLMNVEVLSVIAKDDFLGDFKSEFVQGLSCKFYCLFRNELVQQGLINHGKEKKYLKK